MFVKIANPAFNSERGTFTQDIHMIIHISTNYPHINV